METISGDLLWWDYGGDICCLRSSLALWLSSFVAADLTPLDTTPSPLSPSTPPRPQHLHYRLNNSTTFASLPPYLLSPSPLSTFEHLVIAALPPPPPTTASTMPQPFNHLRNVSLQSLNHSQVLLGASIPQNRFDVGAGVTNVSSILCAKKPTAHFKMQSTGTLRYRQDRHRHLTYLCYFKSPCSDSKFDSRFKSDPLRRKVQNPPFRDFKNAISTRLVVLLHSNLGYFDCRFIGFGVGFAYVRTAATRSYLRTPRAASFEVTLQKTGTIFNFACTHGLQSASLLKNAFKFFNYRSTLKNLDRLGKDGSMGIKILHGTWKTSGSNTGFSFCLNPLRTRTETRLRYCDPFKSPHAVQIQLEAYALKEDGITVAAMHTYLLPASLLTSNTGYHLIAC
ncbi:hypothetical protein C8R43DRAFT_1143675 [Mycena crocata]|nr:hypothetical protein C8R43DRAFT_1143675 [Mycena crocata]